MDMSKVPTVVWVCGTIVLVSLIGGIVFLLWAGKGVDALTNFFQLGQLATLLYAIRGINQVNGALNGHLEKVTDAAISSGGTP